MIKQVGSVGEKQGGKGAYVHPSLQRCRCAPVLVAPQKCSLHRLFYNPSSNPDVFCKMGWDGMAWHGMGWDGLGWVGMGWDVV